MSFEVGGDAQDPFAEEEEDLFETEEESAADSGESASEGGSSGDSPQGERSEVGGSVGREVTDVPESQGITRDTPYVSSLDIREPMSAEEMAQALIPSEYYDDNEPIPYALWRDGTSTGRGRMTIEINKDIDDLLKQVTREFEERHGTKLCKADAREFALMCGIMHLDEVIKMGEEWGLHY